MPDQGIEFVWHDSPVPAGLPVTGRSRWHALVPDDSPQFLKTRLGLAVQVRLEILEARLPGYSPRLANVPALIRWRPAQPGRTIQ